MLADEHEIQQQILFYYGTGDTRLWRNNVGTGWAGKVERVEKWNIHTIKLRPGDVVVHNARPLHSGLCVGSGDLIGLSSVVVTPEMVGTRLAIFANVEVKSAIGRVSKEQSSFNELIRTLGGCSGIARSVEDAKEILHFRF